MSDDTEGDSNYERIENLFKVSRPKKIQKPRDEEENTEQIDTNKFSINSLSYKIIETDMVILGCIRAIKTLSLEIELPCCTNGVLLIKSVSDEFTKNLNKAIDTDANVEEELSLLTNVFEVGQFLPVKVLEKNQTENGVRLILSTKPSDINANRTHKTFKMNSLIWASVVEKADHCYVLNAGIKNCRIILPFKNVQKNKTYVVGEPIYCVVKKCDITNQASTLTVSTIQKDLDNQLELSINLNYILPGAKVDFTIEQITQTGLQGKVFDSFLSCIPQMFYAKPFSNGNKYKEGQTIKAQVMYSEPITNFVYLLMKMESVRPSQKIGAIVNCTVSTKASNGLIVKFNKTDAQGLITYKRLSKSIKTATANLANLLNTKYNISTTHKCRILDYNNMHNLYICTIETDVLKEKYFTVDDLTVGQTVNGKIHDIVSAGIVIKIGHVEGFVPNLHISNVQYADKLKNKYRVGQPLTVKVLQIKDTRLLLTMKRSLVESDNCLRDLEDIDRNKRYSGVVVQITKNDIAFSFYNGIVGYLTQSELNETNIEHIYYLGQVVPIYVKMIKKDKLFLSLEYKEIVTTRKILLGHIVNGTVTNCIDNETLILDITNQSATAELPLAHLSENIEYGKYLLEKYKTGDVIKGLVCVSNTNNKNIVSLREYKHFVNKKIPRYNKLRIGQIIRCSFSHMDDDGFIFTSPIIPSAAKVIIPLTEVIDDLSNIKHIKFVPHQLVIVKIQSLSESLKEIRGTTKLSQVSNFKYNDSLDHLSQYFEDVNNCKADLVERKEPILNYEEGNVVNGTVQYVGSKGGCVMQLENGVKGIVNAVHAKKDVKEGDTVKCIVLYVDYFGGYVDLSMKRKYILKTTDTKRELDMNCNHTIFGIPLLVKDCFVLSLVTKENINKFVYLPTKLHMNDFVPHMDNSKDKIHDKIKLFVIRQSHERIMGLSKHMMNNIEIAERKFNEIKYTVQQLKESLILKEDKSAKKRKLSTSKICAVENNINEDDCNDFVESELFLEQTILNSNFPVSDTESITDHSENVQINIPDTDEFEEERTDDENMKRTKNTAKRRKISEKEKLNSEIDEVDNKKENGLKNDKSSSIDKDVETEIEIEAIDVINEKEKVNSSRKQSVTKTQQEITESSVEDATEAPNAVKSTNKRPIEKMVEKESKKLKADHKIENISRAIIPTKPVLSGVSQFFLDTSLNGINADSSVSEDEQMMIKIEKKRKKMSAKERADLIRTEEEKLREVEVRLADSTAMPCTADEFDRLLLAEPDNSLLWTKYISYFVESTEIDKARAVARRAIQKIKPTSEQDRFNIWVTLLNLENTFGTQESFEKVFEEAARCNDDFKIYMTTIDILGDTQKFTEMDKKIKKCRNKFQQNYKMWFEIGHKLYKYKRIQDARNLQCDAIKSLQDKTKHLEVLIQFAKFEFIYGDKTYAESLFETILLSYPCRSDVWIKYADQLAKKKDYELVRKVFARAIAQKLGIKKMKILFKAYLSFEMQYGTPNEIAKVKELAKDFVKLQGCN